MSSLQRFQEEVRGISARAESPDATVSVVVSGDGDIQVNLHPGALRGVTDAGLAQKINRVIGDAMWELRTEYQATGRQILGTS
jgi:hypothetical protein